jgi:hypothetical protein
MMIFSWLAAIRSSVVLRRPGCLRSVGIFGGHLIQVIGELLAQRRLFVWRPFAKTFAGLEPEFAGGDKRLQVGERPRRAVEIGKQIGVAVEREVGADKVGAFERPDHRQAAAEARLDDDVDGLRIADAVLDE